MKKKEILDRAQELFAASGYEGVSMRDVAKAMGMSVGNLTYHYRRKEELIEAVIAQQSSSLGHTQPLESLAALYEFFQQAVSRELGDHPLFSHYTQLAKLCPAAFDTLTDMLQSMQELLLWGFAELQGKGLVRREVTAIQMRGMVQAQMTILLYGLPRLDPLAGGDCAKKRMQALCSLTELCLSESGQREWEQLLRYIQTGKPAT